jgi:hypothetical protein
VEVASGGSGGGSVRDDATDEQSQRRLNLLLCALVLVSVAAVVFVGVQMVRQYEDGGGDLTGAWYEDAWAVVTDQRSEDGTSRAGEDTGKGTITAVPEASPAEEERIAAALESATKMVTAFVNLRYDDLDASIETVESMAAGNFLEQYRKSSGSLIKVAEQAQTVMTGEVVWSGYVTGDEDSATVLLAASGTVENNLTDKPEARTYRVQVELLLEDDRWLTRDLQFVA